MDQRNLKAEIKPIVLAGPTVCVEKQKTSILMAQKDLLKYRPSQKTKLAEKIYRKKIQSREEQLVLISSWIEADCASHLQRFKMILC